MYNFNRLLVGLENNLLDKVIIDYTAYLTKIYDIEKVTFFHAHKDDRVEKLLHRIARVPFSDQEEFVLEDIKTLVSNHFNIDKKVEVNTISFERNNTAEAVKYVDEHGIDLLVLGKKKNLISNNTYSVNIARKAACSILFVPENSSPVIDNILVPTDFSDNALKALEMAYFINQQEPNVEINVQNIYNPPPKEILSRLSSDELRNEIWEELNSELEESYKNFTNKLIDNNLKINKYFTQNVNYLGAEHCYNLANKINCNLIIVGAIGKTGLSRVLMGSFAEQLIYVSTTIPLLMVKYSENDKELSNLI